MSDTTLFGAAINDPDLIKQIAATVTAVTGNANIDTTPEAQALANELIANPAELASLESALSALAAENGLTFDPSNAQNVTSTQIASFVTAYESAEHASNPASVPVSTPQILLFASTAAIYAKSLGSK